MKRSYNIVLINKRNFNIKIYKRKLKIKKKIEIEIENNNLIKINLYLKNNKISFKKFKNNYFF